MARLDSQLLSTWAVVARCGSINAAASALKVTQPAISNQLKRLADWFGEPLYRRHGRGITLTPAGSRLLRLAQQFDAVLGEAEALRSDIQGLLQGSLVIAASQTNAEFLLVRALAAFQRTYPGVSVRLHAGNSEQARQRMDVADLVFVEDSPAANPSESLVSAPLKDSEIQLLLDPAHPLNQRPPAERIPLTELAQQSLVWREPGSGMRDRVERAFHEAGMAPEVLYEFSGAAAVREAVRWGLGLGFVSALAPTPPDLCARGLMPPIVQQLSVLYQKPLSRTGEEFLGQLKSLSFPAAPGP
ncbi:MAG: LysR substrate-binding domain-containing protein [Gammaproteobacteria bacterium]|nr:LysR substrate-binding domain-containing protein [Gammaproteobacteria bacterium]